MDKVIICIADNTSAIPILSYSIDFCKHFNRDYEVFLIKELSENMIDSELNFLVSHKISELRRTDSKLNQDKIKALVPSDIKMSIYDYSYNIIEALNEMYARKEFSLLILPHSQKEEAWAFSDSLFRFLKKLDVPILLIDPKSRFQEIKHAVYASNLLPVDVNVLNRFRKISDSKIKQIDIIHVSLSDSFTEFLLEKGFEDYIHSNIPDLNIKVHHIPSVKSQETTIETFLKEVNKLSPDMLIIMKEDKSGLEEFFSKSFTLTTAKETSIPMLILHERYATQKE